MNAERLALIEEWIAEPAVCATLEIAEQRDLCAALREAWAACERLVEALEKISDFEASPTGISEPLRAIARAALYVERRAQG